MSDATNPPGETSAAKSVLTNEPVEPPKHRASDGVLEGALVQRRPVLAQPRGGLPSGDLTDWIEGHQVVAEQVLDESVVPIGNILREVRSVIERLNHPELLIRAGGDLPRGLVFSGPPGTGKTLTARYLASHLGSGTRVYEFGGDEIEAGMVRPLFDHLAKTDIRTLLIIDEIEIFALDRNDRDKRHTEATRRALFAMLATLEGFRAFPNVIVIGTTNESTYELDAALMRPGRLGFKIMFPSPSEKEREQLFRLFTTNREFEGQPDWKRCAQLTNGWTPADIRQALDDSLGIALADDRNAPTQKDIEAAVRRNGDLTTEEEEWPEQRHSIAIHELGHAIAILTFFGDEAVSSIRCDGLDGGVTSIQNEQKRYIQTLTDHYNVVKMYYAGAIAGQIMGAEIGPGSASDMRQAAKILNDLVLSGIIEGPLLGIGDYEYGIQAYQLATLREMQRLAPKLWAETQALMGSHKMTIEKLTPKLLAAGVLAGEELRAVLAEVGLITASTVEETTAANPPKNDGSREGNH